ncbi:MAG: hypothetical protein O7D91_00225 [Planctomycetota bacterium]|nr:hypothetical protein [Planctomycetota bacterium]
MLVLLALSFDGAGAVGILGLLALLAVWGADPGGAECKGQQCGAYTFYCNRDDDSCVCYTNPDGSGFCGEGIPCEGAIPCDGDTATACLGSVARFWHAAKIQASVSQSEMEYRAPIHPEVNARAPDPESPITESLVQRPIHPRPSPAEGFLASLEGNGRVGTSALLALLANWGPWP